MKFYINTENSEISEDLVKGILQEIPKQFPQMFDPKKTVALDQYIIDHKMLDGHKCFEVLKLATQNLICENYSSYFLIKIDPNKRLPKSNIRILDACKFITNGNLDISGYKLLEHLLSDVYEISGDLAKFFSD